MRSGNRRTNDSPSDKQSFCVRSSRLNGMGVPSRWACKSAGSVESRRGFSLRPDSTRHFASMACRPTMSERKSLRLASHCCRQRATRRRNQGLSEIVSTNRPAPRPTAVAANRLGSRSVAPRRYSSMQFSSPQERRNMLVATSPICQPSGTMDSLSTSSPKMTDGLADRKIRIQTPIIGLIELQFFRQHAFLRPVFQNRAENR